MVAYENMISCVQIPLYRKQMNELHPRYMFIRPSRSILKQNAAVPWASRDAVATDAHRGQRLEQKVALE